MCASFIVAQLIISMAKVAACGLSPISACPGGSRATPKQLQIHNYDPPRHSTPTVKPTSYPLKKSRKDQRCCTASTEDSIGGKVATKKNLPEVKKKVKSELKERLLEERIS